MPLEEKSAAPSVPPSQAGESDAISTAVPTPGPDDHQIEAPSTSPTQHAGSPHQLEAPPKKKRKKRARGLLAFLFGRDA
jgi:hypothetical protein